MNFSLIRKLSFNFNRRMSENESFPLAKKLENK